MGDSILLGIAIGLPVIIFGIIPGVAFLFDLIKEKLETEHSNYEYLLDSWNWKPRNIKNADSYKQNVVTMPQLTFKQWLKFYESSPSNWVIETDEALKWADIPYYVKVNKQIEKTYVVPTFWKTPRDLKKYRKWVESKYESGNVKGFELERNKHLVELTAHTQDDIKKEINELRQASGSK